MGTLVLSTAGSVAGFALGGPVGAAIGGALGAAAGGVVDQAIFGRSTRREGPRLTDLQIAASTEGAGVARVWGVVRVSPQVIWATDYKETRKESDVGGKGGPSATAVEYSYSVSFAVALCEGPILGIGRVWADGREMDLADFTWRLHLGTEDQEPDPLIVAIEGAGRAPAYRGVAYLVFENLPLDSFGRRAPNITAEVRALSADPDALERRLRAVTLIPGATEFGYGTTPVYRRIGTALEGRLPENVHASADRTDLRASLDRLQEEAPDIEAVALVVAWHGSDLRCGTCRIQPKVDRAAKSTEPYAWAVGPLDRSAAAEVTQIDGGAAVGGAPADRTVYEALRELAARGIAATLYPLIMMDIPAASGLPDPWGWYEQPSYPWRGRITCHPAPGQPGSPDGTAAAEAQVDAFFGACLPSHFGWDASAQRVTYSGPAEWGLRRHILHLATIAAAAGGVEAFLVGSEFVSLTRVRGAGGSYPAVDRLRALAADVRSILGPAVKLSYAADWSEYHSHRPGDGSGDVIFNLDPLWADTNIDFVGIDNYLPLADWRHGTEHLDQLAGWRSPYDRAYLSANIEGGENFAWFYGSDSDRTAQIRTPIVDGAHGEHWVFRNKDLRGWWSTPHRNRPGGVRAATATAWVPQSKPIRFTELGCPAVDLGANQPNVFGDPKSVESGLPWFSRGDRDDLMQRAALEAQLAYWRPEAGFNPVSTVYGGPMIVWDRIHVWTWDARPWPVFPDRVDVWSDGPNHALGHWITGRLGGARLRDVVEDIAGGFGVDIEVADLTPVVRGYVVDRPMSARDALDQLTRLYFFDAAESGETIRFRPRSAAADIEIDRAGLVAAEGAADFALTRAQESELPKTVELGFSLASRDHRRALVRAHRLSGGSVSIERVDSAVSLLRAEAQGIADAIVLEAHVGRDRLEIALPPSRLALDPGDVVGVTLPAGAGERRIAVRLGEIGLGAARAASGMRVEDAVYEAAVPAIPDPPGPPLNPAPPPTALLLDLPLLRDADSSTAHAPKLAAWSEPWSPVAFWSATDAVASPSRMARVPTPAAIGATVAALPRGPLWRWDEGSALDVEVPAGVVLASRPEIEVLGGANACAVEASPGRWEVIQWRDAALIGPRTWRLTGLLRGQRGSDADMVDAIPAGAAWVRLDETLVESGLALDAARLPRRWLWGPDGRAPSDPRFAEGTLTFDAVGLRPLAPVHLRVDQEGADLRLSWIRRTRIGGDAWEVAEVPLGEDAERWLVEILSGPEPAVVLRTFEPTTSGQLYTAALFAADFPVTPAVLAWRVRQWSQSGWGAPAMLIVGIPLLRRLPPSSTLPSIQSVAVSPVDPGVGEVVTATVLASGNPYPTLAYRWRLDGALISGAEAASYETAAPGALVCEARATNELGQTTWVSSAAVQVFAPPAALGVGEATLVDARSSPPALYLWTAAQSPGAAVEIEGFGEQGYAETLPGWLLRGAQAGAEAEIRARRRASTGVSDAITLTATPTEASAAAYTVFSDTPVTRAAQGVVWAAAGLTAAAARTALWAGTALGALTLAGGSVVTPAADGGLTHDADAVAVVDGAVATETFSVARMRTVNALANTLAGWVYARDQFVEADCTLAFPTLTKVAGASSRVFTVTFFTGAGDKSNYFRPGDTITLTVEGNCTAAGTLTVQMQGGVSPSDGASTNYAWSLGSQSVATGAFALTGTITVPAARTVTNTGHAIRIQLSAGFAGVLDLSKLKAEGPLGIVETVTATVLGGAAPGAAAPAQMDAPALAGGETSAMLTLGAAPFPNGAPILRYDWQAAVEGDAAFAAPVASGAVVSLPPLPLSGAAFPVTLPAPLLGVPDQALLFGVAMTPLDLAPYFLGGAASGPFSLDPAFAAIIGGIALNPATGVLSGTPTDARGRGWHRLRVVNAFGHGVFVRMCSAPDVNPANYAHVIDSPVYTAATTIQGLVGPVLILNPTMTGGVLNLRNLSNVVVFNPTMNSSPDDNIRLSSLGNTENVTIWGGLFVEAGWNAISTPVTDTIRHPGLRVLNPRILTTGLAGGSVAHHGLYIKADDALIEGAHIGPDADHPAALGMTFGNGVSMRSGGVVRGCKVRGTRQSGVNYYANSNGAGRTVLFEDNDIDDVNRAAEANRGAIDLLGPAADAPLANFVAAVTIRNNAVGENPISRPFFPAGIPVTETGNGPARQADTPQTGFRARSRAVNAIGDGPWSAASAVATVAPPPPVTAITLAPADFTLVAGRIEANTGGLGHDTLSAPLDNSTILDARRTLTGLTDGAYRVDVLHHDEADGPGRFELWVGDVLCASHLMTMEPTGELGPTLANLITWTVPAVNLRDGDVLRLVCRPASGEPGRTRSVTLERIGPVDPALAPDTDPGLGTGLTALTGSGTLNLGAAVSHYTVDAPEGVPTIRGYTLAGFEPTHPDLADAHVYVVNSSSTSATTPGTLAHAMKAGTRNHALLANGTVDPNQNGATTGKTKGPRLVIFHTGMTINLGNTILDGTRADVWVNANIAPGPVIITGNGVKVRDRNTLIEGVHFFMKAPASADQADDIIGWGAVITSQVYANTVDHGIVACALYTGCNENPQLLSSSNLGTKNVVRPTMIDCVATHSYRAQGTYNSATDQWTMSPGWENFHEGNHNLAALVGAGVWNAFFADNIFAGMNYRTPVIHPACTAVAFSNYIVDSGFDPIQFSENGDAGLPGHTVNFPTLSATKLGAGRELTAIGNHFEPGTQKWAARASKPLVPYFTGEGGSTNKPLKLHVRRNRFDPSIPVADFSGAPGPNHSDIERPPATNRTNVALPLVWPDRLPTHPSETRAWTLAHAGPRPNGRTAVPLFNSYVNSIAAHNSKAWASRDPLYLTNPATPSLGTLGSWTAPTLPADAWATEANGMLRIVNWMHQLRRDLGGTPFGNVDRPVTTWAGGRLTVTAAGVVTWDAADADPGHPPITLRIKTVAGDEIDVTITAV